MPRTVHRCQAEVERGHPFGASLHSARLTEADLIGANLTRAVLSGAIALTQEQLDAACGDAEIKLDPGLAVPPC